MSWCVVLGATTVVGHGVRYGDCAERRCMHDGFWARFAVLLRQCVDCGTTEGVFYMLGGVSRCDDCLEVYLWTS